MHHESHVHIAERVGECDAALVVFNLGYLPGADHAVCTTGASTITALEASMQVRCPLGLLHIARNWCLYVDLEPQSLHPAEFSHSSFSCRHSSSIPYVWSTMLIVYCEISLLQCAGVEERWIAQCRNLYRAR